MLTLSDIRSEFLKYFESKKHKILKSAPLIPEKDPTLLFTNAGMVQFKNYFTGVEKPKYKNVATAQKCVRAGGKHNDLDNVGYTARHLTFFEMLGNFSFGGYFKEDAIKFAWEFLTRILRIPKEKLYVTVYHTDEEAYKIWQKVSGLSNDRIIKIKTNDNFWSMGDTGPCGPCSEIFFDHGEAVEGGLPGTPKEEGDRYIEIWNLVFMQYEKLENGKMIDLPKPCIDTGSGLERLTTVIQGVHNNYDIDLFKKLINNSKLIIGDNGNVFAHRIIADHLRSSAFLIADGILPSNEGRGYVLRRIMRRAMRHVHSLSPKEAKMYLLVPTLVELMSKAYPELVRAQSLIMETLKSEEERFRKTIDNGLKLLDEELGKLGAKKVLDGKVAFMLYDTYGFPLDLTEDILREKGILVDNKGFEAEMTKQKQMSKEAWSGSGDVKTSKVYFDTKERVGETKFIGYTDNVSHSRILAIFVDGKEAKSVKKGDKFEFVVDITPFYGEAGGQTGDSGLVIKSSDDGTINLPFSIIQVNDTKKPIKNFHVHKGIVEQGEFKVGDYINMAVNKEKRRRIQANHSAAHLLHFALRALFGDSVHQKGSAVSENGLRLDVSYSKAITKTELKEVERIVNKMIGFNFPVKTECMDIEDARETGAMALFGEKYDEEVRVVSIGQKSAFDTFSKASKKAKKAEYTVDEAIEELNELSGSEREGINMHSIELCGGTHVERSGDIGFFKITSEGAIAAGIRRIEAVTGLKALEFVQKQMEVVQELADVSNAPVGDLTEKMKNLIAENKKLKKEAGDAKKSSLSSDTKFDTEKVGNINLVSHTFDDINPKDLKGTVQTLMQKKDYKENTVMAFFGINEGKVSAVVAVSSDLVNAKKTDAPKLVKLAVSELGGQGGGGQPTIAMGGGSDKSKIGEAVKKIKNELKN